MTLKDLNNKKIAMLGLGAENYALLKFLLAKKINCQITICDQRSIKALADKFTELNKHANIFWQLEKKFKANLGRYDLLFRSPGWPLDCPGIKQGHQDNLCLKTTSAMRLFFDLCPTKNIIGVTGTKGKGTTSSLIYAILKAGKKRVFLGGNIGIAPFAFLSKIKSSDWLVLELSSFQLEDLHTSPHIAVLTNFYPEHLAPADPNNPNYHKSLKAYWLAKQNIIRWQTKKDWLIINQKLKSQNKQPSFAKGYGRARQTTSNVIYFTKSALPSGLVGAHNQENVAAAEAVAKIVGIKPSIIAKAVKNFKGLEHRLEFVREVRGVKYFDDSFATTPESTIIALKSFNSPIILLAGGADKGANFKQLAKAISKQVKFVCLLKGQATPRIKQELIRLKFSNYKIFDNLAAAVKVSSKLAAKGDVVLLSTACASFGMFKNYKERGNLFKTFVKKLPAHNA